MDTGELEKLSVTGEVLSPSYLAVNEERVFAITCDIEAGCHVKNFRRDDDRSLTAAGVQPTDGRAGCHVLDLPGGALCAVSYLDSSISIFPTTDGELGPRRYYIRYKGSSINAERQEDSHAHHAALSPDARWLYVCDLGADCIWRHELKDDSVTGAAPEKIFVPPGYGPRHLAFHPSQPRAFVICELNSHLLTFDWRRETGGFELVSDLPSLPADWTKTPAGAAIKVHPSGAALYVSNRTSDSLDFFTLDAAGLPTPAGHMASGGVCPRDFDIDPSGRWLLAANQDSHTIAVHELCPRTGMPVSREPALFEVGSPACVVICPSGQK
jgi:6-phosphogluconolactonase